MQNGEVNGEFLTLYSGSGTSYPRGPDSAGFLCPATRGLCRSVIVASCLSLALAALGCGVIRKRPEEKPSGLDIVGASMTNEQAKEVLGTVGGNFAYGSGLGDAALSIGTVVLFPPYALYLLGNAALSVSGYEPVTISSLLPEEDGKQWSSTYDKVVSGPGRVVAAVAGHEYRSQDRADERLRAVFAEIQATPETK